jgi:hypothetical protein
LPSRATGSPATLAAIRSRVLLATGLVGSVVGQVATLQDVEA